MRHPILAAASLLLAASAVPAATRTYEIDRGRSKIGFVIGGMIGKVHGRFTKFEGSIEGDPNHPEVASVALTIQAASITTALPRRDEHLRGPDFFDVKTFPELTFRSKKIVSRDKDRYDVHGPLTIHGVTKTVVLPVKLTRTDLGSTGVEKVRFELATTLIRQDYGIVWNKTLESGGLLLGDDVAVEIELSAVARP
jgi:polyisoprenoid-binding protein YceI